MKKYSEDKKVEFDSSNHTYYLGEKKLTSVTQFIEPYKIPFDSEVIGARYAEKHNLNREEVLKGWHDNMIKAGQKGTELHKLFEDYINIGSITRANLYEEEETVIKFIKDYFESERLRPIEAERIVYNDILAGQVDCIVENQKNEYFILDWKSNKSIDYESYNKKMTGPFIQYPDSNFYHYSIQLRIYQKLCKKYDIKDCFIVHITTDKYDLIKCNYINLDGII